MAEYVPGVCNIGKNETRKRYGLAVTGFVLSAIIAYAIPLFHLPGWVIFFSYIFLLLGFEGFYQGYFKFCAGFAAKGIYDFKGSGGSRSKVDNPEYHRKDMGMAQKIHLYSIVSSIIVVVIAYFVMLFI